MLKTWNCLHIVYIRSSILNLTFSCCGFVSDSLQIFVSLTKNKKKLHRSGSFFFSTHHTHSHGFKSTNTFVRFLKIKMKKGISSSKTSLNTQHIYKIYPQTHREWEWTRKRWGEKLSLKFILPAKLCSFFEAYFQFNMYTNTFCNSAGSHTQTYICPIYSGAWKTHSHRKT